MKHVLGKYIYTEEEVALLRKVINRAPGTQAKFDALALVKSKIKE